MTSPAGIRGWGIFATTLLLNVASSLTRGVNILEQCGSRGAQGALKLDCGCFRTIQTRTNRTFFNYQIKQYLLIIRQKSVPQFDRTPQRPFVKFHQPAEGRDKRFAVEVCQKVTERWRSKG